MSSSGKTAPTRVEDRFDSYQYAGCIVIPQGEDPSSNLGAGTKEAA